LDIDVELAINRARFRLAIFLLCDWAGGRQNYVWVPHPLRFSTVRILNFLFRARDAALSDEK
jgi:hypothetical protein